MLIYYFLLENIFWRMWTFCKASWLYSLSVSSLSHESSCSPELHTTGCRRETLWHQWADLSGPSSNKALRNGWCWGSSHVPGTKISFYTLEKTSYAQRDLSSANNEINHRRNNLQENPERDHIWRGHIVKEEGKTSGKFREAKHTQC